MATRGRSRAPRPLELASEDRGVVGLSHRILRRDPSSGADDHAVAREEGVVLKHVASGGKGSANLREAGPPGVVVAPEQELPAWTLSDPGEVRRRLLEVASPREVAREEDRVLRGDQAVQGL